MPHEFQHRLTFVRSPFYNNTPLIGKGLIRSSKSDKIKTKQMATEAGTAEGTHKRKTVRSQVQRVYETVFEKASVHT